jgi:hypothetical protein
VSAEFSNDPFMALELAAFAEFRHGFSQQLSPVT